MPSYTSFALAGGFLLHGVSLFTRIGPMSVQAMWAWASNPPKCEPATGAAWSFQEGSFIAAGVTGTVVCNGGLAASTATVTCPQSTGTSGDGDWWSLCGSGNSCPTKYKIGATVSCSSPSTTQGGTTTQASGTASTTQGGTTTQASGTASTTQSGTTTQGAGIASTTQGGTTTQASGTASTTQGGTTQKSSGGSGGGGLSTTKNTYKTSVTAEMTCVNADKVIKSAAGTKAFEDAFKKTMPGATISQTKLSKVGCRRLSDGVRRLATTGVQADFTYTSTASTQPDGAAFKTALNTELKKNALPEATSVTSGSKPDVSLAQRTGTHAMQFSAMVFAVVLTNRFMG